jgi:hypothetical protein
MSENSKNQQKQPGRRIQAIRREIASISQVAQGTITQRTKVCGRPNCRCAQDPAARHGPYYEWTRREQGRYMHTLISAEQAEELQAAIDNHRRILVLLARWSTETARSLGVAPGRK